MITLQEYIVLKFKLRVFISDFLTIVTNINFLL